MYKTHLFTTLFSSHSRLRKTSFGMAVCLLCFSLFLVCIPAQAMAATHGCAPQTPPPVSGNPVPDPPTSGSVWINEIVSNPHSTWNCSEPAHSFTPSTDAWVEIYNPQNQPLNLYASHASISVDGGTNWYHFPFGAAIAAGGFLVVFPLAGLNTSAPPAWNVMLNIGNTTIDQVNVPILVADQSYARIPDGSSNWQLVGQPTIDASNNASGQPVTPTPTKTPSPTKTPKLARGTDPSASTTPTNSGTQPAWGQLQLPPGATPPADTPGSFPTPAFSQNSPTTSGTPPDSGQIVLFATLILLLCGVVAWCWRLFRAP